MLSLLGLTAVIALEFYAVVTLLPVVVVDLDAVHLYALAYGSTLITGLVGTVLAGAWTDRHPTTVPLLCGGGIFIAGIVLCTIAPTIEVFILGRMLKGLGGGMDAVVVHVIIARRFDQRRRTSMLGLSSAAWLLPSLIGPLAVGLLADALGWRISFGLVALGATASLIGLLRTSGDTTPASPPDGDERAATGRGRAARRLLLACLAGGAALALHTAGQGDSPSSASDSTEDAARLLILTLAGLGLLIAARGLLPAGTFTARTGIPRLVVVLAALAAVKMSSEAHVTLYLQHERGLHPSAAGGMIAVGAIGWAAGSWYQSRRDADEAQDARLIGVAVIAVACGPAWMLALSLTAVPPWTAAAASLLMGAGMGICYPRLIAGALRLAPEDQQGSVSSALQAAQSMAATGLLALTGALLGIGAAASGPNFVVVYAVLTVLGAAAATVGLSLPRGAPREASRSEMGA